MKTKVIESNCILGSLYLLLRRKAQQVITFYEPNSLIKYHVGILTKKGHYLNFRELRDQPKTSVPAMFLGRFEGIRKSRCLKILHKKKPIILPYGRMILTVVGSLIWFGLYIIIIPLWRLLWAK